MIPNPNRGRLLLLAAATVAALTVPSTVEAQRQPNIQLTFRLVEANGFETPDPEIQDVVSELQEIFRFEGYRLLSTSVINTVPEGGDFSQQISTSQGGRFALHGAVSQDTNEDRFYQTRVNLLEVGPAGHEGLLSASVNMHDNQTVVLGSARTTEESIALILVMTAKFSY